MELKINTDKKPEDINFLEFLILSYHKYLDEESLESLGLTDESLVKLEEAKYIKTFETEEGVGFDIRAKALEFEAEEVEGTTTGIDWIDKYRKLFKEKSNKPGIMGSKSAVNKKMKSFLKSNPKVTKEEVLGATKLYLDGMYDKTYIQQADYFISKNSQSRLEAFIEEYRDTDKTTPQTFYDSI